jgi:hypothetical protein
LSAIHIWLPIFTNLNSMVRAISMSIKNLYGYNRSMPDKKQ